MIVTLQVTRRKVTTLVTAGLLLLGINNGQAVPGITAPGMSSPAPTPSLRSTPIPTPTASPIPSATPVSTPVPTPVPTVSPPSTPPPATPAPSVSSSSAFPNLGTAGKYAVLSLSGTFQNQSLVTINGDVGIGPSSVATTQASSVINGSVYYDPSTRYSALGTVTGGSHVQSMMQAGIDAWNASNYYKNYANQSNVFSSISAATTIVGHTGFNVFSLSGGITLNNASLTLTGSSNDYFVFNIYGGLTLTGTSSINLTGGLTASNVLFNFIGSGSALTTQLGATVRGTILSIGRSISFDGVFIGEIIGGGPGSVFALLSGTTINPLVAPAPPPQSVPDQGSTIWLSLIALSSIVVVQRRLRKKSAPRQT